MPMMFLVDLAVSDISNKLSCVPMNMNSRGSDFFYFFTHIYHIRTHLEYLFQLGSHASCILVI